MVNEAWKGGFTREQVMGYEEGEGHFLQHKGALTEPAFWDRRWESWHGSKVITKRDRVWGSEGAFMTVLRQHVGSVNGLSVIELGGAASYYLLSLAKWAAATVTAVDYSPVGLSRTEEVFSRNGMAVETVLADFFSWRSDRRYDLVLHLGLLEHFLHPEMVLNLTASLLKPGGKTFFTMPNMQAFAACFWRRFAPVDWSKHTYHSDEVIRTACDSAGLRLERSFYWGSPLLQITKWETPGIVPISLTFLQRCFGLLNKMVPYYHLGIRPISSLRGFVATRV